MSWITHNCVNLTTRISIKICARISGRAGHYDSIATMTIRLPLTLMAMLTISIGCKKGDEVDVASEAKNAYKQAGDMVKSKNEMPDPKSEDTATTAGKVTDQKIGQATEHGSGKGAGVGGLKKGSAKGNKDGRPGGHVTAHGSGTGGGFYGRKGAKAGNKDGKPGGSVTDKAAHGTGKGGGHLGGKSSAKGNKDGLPGGVITDEKAHGSGKGGGRGLGVVGSGKGDRDGKMGTKPDEKTDAPK